MRWFIAIVAAGGLLAGCGGGEQPPGAFPTYNAGDHTVAVAPYESLQRLADSLDAYVSSTPIVATVKVVAVNDMAYEVQPNPNAEGAISGEGPDIFGTVTFDLVAVHKGQVKPNTRLTVTFESGKWNKADKKMRLAYRHERLELLQTDRAALKTPEELKDLTFLLFATPGKKDAISQGNALLQGLAKVNSAGIVQFPGEAPFLRPSSAGAMKLEDFIQAASK